MKVSTYRLSAHDERAAGVPPATEPSPIRVKPIFPNTYGSFSDVSESRYAFASRSRCARIVRSG
jgi:hypothetical protein